MKWLGSAFVRAAIIPLLLIEISFIFIYWSSSNFTYKKNAEAIQAVSQNYLADIAGREAMNIQATLGSVEGLARLYAMETREALATPYQPSAAEKARYGLNRQGVFYTRRNSGDGTASFYSGIVPVGPRQIDKVWRTARLDQTMRHIKASSPLVRQVYLNSWDSYNRIYPYFDVTSQYAPKMNIPAYNFYYEADAQHNPERRVVWTDAYVDPAGGGWMVSAIAPVYGAKRLEAVIGIDLTVDTMLKRILDITLPWQGYAILIGRDGTILALPPAGERDLGLRELRDHHYDDAIRADTFKPANFNITRRPDLKPLAAAVMSGKSRITRISLGGKEMLAVNARVQGPGWNLVVMAPAQNILADAAALHQRLQEVGLAMLVILLAFYALFFIYLRIRARAMSHTVAEPLRRIEGLMERIGAGEYDHAAPQFGVAEIDNVASRLVGMSGKLGAAYRQIVETQEEVRRALDSEKRITTGQRRFINVLSHEFRTPLTVIDSCGQILRRRATRITEDTALERSDMIRRAAARMDDVMKSAMQLVQLEEGEISCKLAQVPLAHVLRDAIAAGRQDGPEITLVAGPDAQGASLHVDPALIRSALAALIDNACKYTRPGTPIAIETALEDGNCRIIIRDQGLGIPAQDLPLIRERFYRGANSTAIPGAGTGLFLAATLIEAHGGRLDIESTPDVGTVATVILPLAKACGPDLAEAA